MFAFVLLVFRNYWSVVEAILKCLIVIWRNLQYVLLLQNVFTLTAGKIVQKFSSGTLEIQKPDEVLIEIKNY
jgi:hypothetical protein